MATKTKFQQWHMGRKKKLKKVRRSPVKGRSGVSKDGSVIQHSSGRFGGRLGELV